MTSRPTRLRLVLVLLAFAGPAAAADRYDIGPFQAEARLAAHPADPILRDFLQGVAAAGRLEEAQAEQRLKAVWSNPKAPPAMAREALEIAGTAALRAGRYAEASDLLARALASADLDADARRDLEQTRDVAEALRAEPAQSVAQGGAADIPLAISPLGLTTAPARIEGHDQAAVIDTGANISTLSATAAKALGVRMMAHEGAIGSATVRALPSQIAVADSVQIGPVTLHHVAFIVLDDAALSPAGPERRIDAILGFPVLSALGRISLVQDGDPQHRRMIVSAPQAGRAPGNLRFAGFDMLVRVRAGADLLPLQLDSGANQTALSKLYAKELPQRLAGLARKPVKVGGAGGVETRDTAILPHLAITVGDQTVELANVGIEISGSGSDKVLGVLGADVLWAKGGYTLDFRNLDLSLGGPRAR